MRRIFENGSPRVQQQNGVGAIFDQGPQTLFAGLLHFHCLCRRTAYARGRRKWYARRRLDRDVLPLEGLAIFHHSSPFRPKGINPWYSIKQATAIPRRRAKLSWAIPQDLSPQRYQGP